MLNFFKNKFKAPIPVYVVAQDLSFSTPGHTSQTDENFLKIHFFVKNVRSRFRFVACGRESARPPSQASRTDISDGSLKKSIKRQHIRYDLAFAQFFELRAGRGGFAKFRCMSRQIVHYVGILEAIASFFLG